MKRTLFGANPAATELHGEKEACLVARARARLLLALAHCSALPGVPTDAEASIGGDEQGGEAVVRRVRDAADCVLGEVLQVILVSLLQTGVPILLTKYMGEKYVHVTEASITIKRSSPSGLLR